MTNPEDPQLLEIYSVGTDNSISLLYPNPNRELIQFAASMPDGSGKRDQIMSSDEIPYVVRGYFVQDHFSLRVIKAPDDNHVGVEFLSHASDMMSQKLAAELSDLLTINLSLETPPHAMVAFLS